MSPVSRIAGTGLALALVLAVAGCVTPPTSSATFLAEPGLRHPLVAITDPEVLAYCPADAPVAHLPRLGVTIEDVYICRGDDHRGSDGVSTYGPWQAAYRVPDPRELLEAYAVPNLQRSVGLCFQSGTDPLLIWLHQGGEVRAYYAPVDPCGRPQDDARTAYALTERELLVEVDAGDPEYPRDRPAEH